MKRLHLFLHLRTVLFLVVVCLLVSGAGVLWWANQTGLPDSWRAKMESEMAKQGVFLRIGSLRYTPFVGITATDVHIFAESDQKHELSSVEQVILALDRTKLARGKFKLNKVELSDAAINLAVDPKDPSSQMFRISNVSGVLSMPGGRMMEVRDARGQVDGININFSARMLGYKPYTGDPVTAEENSERREILIKIIELLDQWQYGTERPPELNIVAEGDISDRSTLRAKLRLEAYEVEKNYHTLDRITVEGVLARNILTLSSFTAADPHGVLEGHADYDLENKSGRFDISSSIEIPALLKAWFKMPAIRDVRLDGDQEVQAVGEFATRDDGTVDVQVTGDLSCANVNLKDIEFDQVVSSFSWRENELYLRDLRLTRPDGVAEGKALIQSPQVRLQLKSTLPPKTYVPLFKDKPLEMVINHFSPSPDTKIEVELDGGFDLKDKTAWTFSGKGNLSNATYNGVPLESAQTHFALSHHELDFFQGHAVFNYRDYALRKTYNGPRRGAVDVGRIRYVRETQSVEVENVSGEIWAAPLVRTFAPKIADTLEVYRFHRPPLLSANGVIGIKNRSLNALSVSFDSNDSADYYFLGKDLSLAAPSGNVLIGDDLVTVSNLSVQTLGGEAAGKVQRRGNGKLEAEVNWKNLSLAELAKTYDFNIKGDGILTGRIDITMDQRGTRSMQGLGLLALEQTELFSVPIFGPLASTIDSVLGENKKGYAGARDAFLTFIIENGVLKTSDFQTSNSSLTITGEGEVDLTNRHLAVMMRMNARGFLGLITLPLRPLYGLFQFHGTGPISKPKWESVLFTSPSEAQQKVLVPPPKAIPVGE